MTALLDGSAVDQLALLLLDKDLGDNRVQLLGGIDRRYAGLLPHEDAPLDQIRSDLRALNELPYLAAAPGSVRPPFERYLQNLAAQLGDLQEADLVTQRLDEVRAAAEPAATDVASLLDALAAAHPDPAEIDRLAEQAGLEPAGGEGTAWERWSLTLHLAGARDLHGPLVEAAAGAAAEPQTLQELLARRDGWLGPVADAADVHLRLALPAEVERVSWNDVVQRFAGATAAVVADLQAVTGPGSQITHDQLCIERRSMDERFAQFTGGDRSAFVLVGDTGIGKTSLVLRWVELLQQQGHAVLLLTGARLRPADVWEEVIEHLEVDPESEWLEALGRAAAEHERMAVIVVDGVNEYLAPPEVEPARLVESVNRRLDDLPAAVRIVLTSTTPTWRRIYARSRAALRLSRYFESEGDIAVTVPEFDDRELGEAWERYRELFSITTPFPDLPRTLRAQLRNPALMFLTATTFQGSAVPTQDTVAAIDIFRRYYETRTRSDPDPDREFLRVLSLEMYESRRSPIPTALLHSLERLSRYMTESPDSVFARMLDQGVLRRVELPGEVPPDSVEYAVSRFGAWVLAGALKLEKGTPFDAATASAEHIDDFPPIVDTLRILIQEIDRPEQFVALAGDARPVVRQTVVDALAELAFVKAGLVREVVDKLVFEEDMTREQHRTGMWAAHAVSVSSSTLDLSDVFRRAAASKNTEVRREATDALYLIWRQDPEFTYRMLETMAEDVPSLNLLGTRRMLAFMGDLSITLYTNHPGFEVGKPTSDLWHRVSTRRLHLDRLDVAGVRDAALWAANLVFSKKIYQGFLLNDAASVEKIFTLDEPTKSGFRQGIDLLDPAAGIGSNENRDLLAALLGAEQEIFRLLAAQTIAVHAVADFERTTPVVHDLYGRLGREGRIWLLTAFAVLWDATPAAWTPLLEELTTTTVADHPEILGDETLGFLGDPLRLDQVLFPLALAYGKASAGMPALEELIATGLTAHADVQVGRCLAVVGRAGFHHPRVALDLLRTVWDRAGEPAVQAGSVTGMVEGRMIEALASIRTLHRDFADDFLLEVAASPEWRTRVARAESEETQRARIRDQVLLLGLYNNGVHQAVCFPTMRQGLLMPIYRSLCDSPNLKEATEGLTRAAWKMFTDAEFRLENWAVPKSDLGPCS